MVYAILYAFLSTTSVLYLCKKGASRKIQLGVFLGLTLAFVGRVLWKLGLLSTFDELFWALPSVALYSFAMAIWAPIFYFGARSLRGFVLFAAAHAVMFFFPNFEGVSDSTRAFLDLIWWFLVVALVLGSGVFAYRDYVKWKASEF